MSEHDKEAAELLPCTSGFDLACNPLGSIKCESCYRRPAVAARLAERDSIIESIYEALDGLPMTGEKTSPKSREYLDAVGQIKALKAQLAAAEQRCKELEGTLELLLNCWRLGVAIPWGKAQTALGIGVAAEQAKEGGE